MTDHEIGSKRGDTLVSWQLISEESMSRALLAVAVAGLVYAAVPSVVQASPLVPPQGLSAMTPNLLTDVQWRRCWRDRWGRLHCRSCWRDRWGRTICR